jgi:hypothetical protein
MRNEDNLKPAERAEAIIKVCFYNDKFSIASYFLNELAKNAKHASFDDMCYWKDVEEEFKIKTKI